ncbi:hypothetical protein [Actinoallomurus sp. CA-150999]|uniref:hypothetical protein n=1 Tax=Actinoallomurus sp. CA-150999 TaxID=3239887 RepID=UPI003D9161E9
MTKAGSWRFLKDVRVWMLVGLIAGIAPAAWYGVYQIFKNEKTWLTSSYMIQLMGGWLATVMGVVIGLPIAAWLADRASAAERRKQRQQEERLAADMRARTLTVVGRELASSLPGLQEMASGTLTRFHYNVGRWNALTSSGDLKWIRTLSVIDDLAEAYEALEVVNVLASSWLTSLGTHRIPGEGPHLARQLAVEAANDATAAIEKALQTVDAELPQPVSAMERQSKV